MPDDEQIQINDLFWTLQGEGHFSGRRALFIRLPFCNYHCPWCDTEFNSFKKYSEQQLINFIEKEPSRFAVLTGGEPLIHKDLPKILELLKKKKFFIACETNGSFPVPKEIDFVTTSPKKYSGSSFEEYYIHPQVQDRTNEWKYVVDECFDFDKLKRHEPFKKKVYYSLSPEFTQMKKNTNTIIDFIKSNPRWQLSLQTHKWIGIP